MHPLHDDSTTVGSQTLTLFAFPRSDGRDPGVSPVLAGVEAPSPSGILDSFIGLAWGVEGCGIAGMWPGSGGGGYHGYA
jgi:hypothetical protein